MTVDAKQTRAEQLIEQAIKLFSRGGYRETSLQEIANQLGITRPLFYYYFESKEDLLWQIIGHLGDDLLGRARPIAASDRPPDERLRLLLLAHAEAILNDAAAFRIYQAERHLVSGKRDRVMRQGEDAYIAIITDVLKEGQRAGVFGDEEPHIMALLLTGMGNSMLKWYMPGGPRSLAEVSQTFAKAALAAVARRPEEPPPTA